MYQETATTSLFLSFPCQSVSVTWMLRKRHAVTYLSWFQQAAVLKERQTERATNFQFPLGHFCHAYQLQLIWSAEDAFWLILKLISKSVSDLDCSTSRRLVERSDIGAWHKALNLTWVSLNWRSSRLMRLTFWRQAAAAGNEAASGTATQLVSEATVKRDT